MIFWKAEIKNVLQKVFKKVSSLFHSQLSFLITRNTRAYDATSPNFAQHGTYLEKGDVFLGYRSGSPLPNRKTHRICGLDHT